MAAHAGSKKVIYAALAGNLLIAVTKFGAAACSPAARRCCREGVHSLVDTGNETAAAATACSAPSRPPTSTHPLGHGRELYFWSFIVALLVFALGAGVSLYEGIMHILEPVPVENPLVNYIVLGLSFLFEGSSWMVALREFRRSKGKLGYIAGGAAEQGSERLHRAVRGQRRACRPGDRVLRHPRRAAARGARARRRRLDRHRPGAWRNGRLPRPREQGAADRRTCAAGGGSGGAGDCRRATPTCSRRTASSRSISAPTRSSRRSASSSRTGLRRRRSRPAWSASKLG